MTLGRRGGGGQWGLEKVMVSNQAYMVLEVVISNYAFTVLEVVI